jgi:hypothetical protein
LDILIATSINDSGGKFATVSTKLVTRFFRPFAPGVNDTVVLLPQIFKQILNNPYGILRCFGETDA